MLDWLNRSLVTVVPRDQRDTAEALRRRQVVTAAVVLVGGAVLGLSLRIEPGSDAFYAGTALLALVWTVGAVASGRLHLGRIPRAEDSGRPIAAPIMIGLLLAAIFIAGGLVVREIDWLDQQVRSVLDFADQGSIPLLLVITIVNGIAEELFFRGAVYAAIPRHPVVWTTVAYFVATLATGNIMLAFAAILLGAVCGLQRRASGGVLAPILTHITWSVVMLFALPAIFG